jgi:methionyl-tRNA formyltransferase
MNLVFVGFHQEGYDCLSALLSDGFPFRSVVTFEMEKVRSLSGGVDFEPLARRYEVPLRRVQSINHRESIDYLRTLDPDIIFVIGWTEIVKKEVLSLPRLGCIGMHASLLPRYRGGSPVNWALIHGESETGNTMFWLSAGLDLGDIIDQEPIRIDVHDSCGTLYTKVGEAGIRMLRRNIRCLMTGTAPRRRQTDWDLPRWPRRKPEQGLIDWERDSRDVYNLIRAVAHPYPGAFTSNSGRTLFIWEAFWAPEWPVPTDSAPGTIVAVLPGFGRSRGLAAVQCRTGAVLLSRVQWEGGPECDACDLVESGDIRRGMRI